MMDFEQKTSKFITDTTSRPRPTSAQGSMDRPILKPKLSIVNPKKSKFATNLVTVPEEVNDIIDENGTTNSTESLKSSSKKRKSSNMSRDSDDELANFDFGDDMKLKPCKVGRMSGNSASRERTTSASGRSVNKRRAEDSSDDSDW
jgi:hypothetical protein